MQGYFELKPEETEFNVFNKIGKDWMLITASDGTVTNTMTASWGGMGVMFNKNVVYIVIRPQRYTKEFIDKNNSFSINFLDGKFKEQLAYLGSVSGRNEDKIAKAGLNAEHENGVPFFKEADMVFFCKSLFAQEMKQENFLDLEAIEKWYPDKDFHTLYIAEIEHVFQKVR